MSIFHKRQNNFSGLAADIPALISNTTYNILKITPPTEITNSIVSAEGKRNIFKVIYRKNVIYDLEGRYTKELNFSNKNCRAIVEMVGKALNCLSFFLTRQDCRYNYEI